MQELRSILDAFNDPASRHAMLVHMPIALAMLGVPVVIAAALLRGQRPLRIVAILLYVLLAGACMLAVDSGEAAQDDLPGGITATLSDVVDAHARVARTTYFAAGGVAILLLLGAFLPTTIAVGANWLAVIVAVAAGVLVGLTGHRGGIAVYEHGAGTPDLILVGPPDAGTTRMDETTGAVLTSDDVFASLVYPILETNCLRCHGRGRTPKAGLTLASVDGILAGGATGSSIVPGDPEASLLVQRITAEDPDDLMPPTGERLPDEDIAVIRRWIRDGSFPAHAPGGAQTPTE